MPTPIIYTVYNHRTDPTIPNYQRQVIEKFTTTIPFVSEESFHWNNDPYVTHGDCLNLALRNYMASLKFDTFILLDVDCIPLHKDVIDLAIEVANKGKIIGNAQKFNRYLMEGYELSKASADIHPMYIAPSFMCFTKELYYDLGWPSFTGCHGLYEMLDEYAFDTAENFSMQARKNNIELEFFLPTSSIIENNWGDENIKYGVGTTYSYQNVEVTYHNWFSRYNFHNYNELFVKKAKEILNLPLDING